MIDGVNYEFDLTQPPRYDGECKLINPNSHRVVNLTYQGKPVDPKAEFLIATNNYRAYGNKFPRHQAMRTLFTLLLMKTAKFLRIISSRKRKKWPCKP